MHHPSTVGGLSGRQQPNDDLLTTGSGDRGSQGYGTTIRRTELTDQSVASTALSSAVSKRRDALPPVSVPLMLSTVCWFKPELPPGRTWRPLLIARLSRAHGTYWPSRLRRMHSD